MESTAQSPLDGRKQTLQISTFSKVHGMIDRMFMALKNLEGFAHLACGALIDGDKIVHADATRTRRQHQGAARRKQREPKFGQAPVGVSRRLDL